MTKILKIENAWIINPFFYFGLMWVLTIAGYYISPSKYCLALDGGLSAFLFISIVVSSFLMLTFNDSLKNKEILIEYERPSNLFLGVLISLFLFDIIGSGGAPLFTYLFNEGGVTYSKFGVKTLHVIVVTFALYSVTKYSLQYSLFKRNRDLIIVMSSFIYFLLAFSRGLLLFSLIIVILTNLMDKKIKAIHVCDMIFLFFLVSWTFGVLGNIRVGSNWNDTSVIFRLAGVQGDSTNLFAPMYWVLEYLTCSLRTLNYNVIEILPVYSFSDMLYHFMPDFISKRIFLDGVVKPILQLNWCTTYTMYGGSFATYGFIGMVLKLFTYMIVAILMYLIRFKSFLYNIVGLTLLSVLYVFSIFSDMLMYSGYSFALFYVVLFGKFVWNFTGINSKV